MLLRGHLAHVGDDQLFVQDLLQELRVLDEPGPLLCRARDNATGATCAYTPIDERWLWLDQLKQSQSPALLVYSAHSAPASDKGRDGPASSDLRRPVLLAVFDVPMLGAVQGWFSGAQGVAYRELVLEATANEPGEIVEVGCWRGRSTAYIGRLCAIRKLALHCVDTWAGSSDDYDNAYREMLAKEDIFAAFSARMKAIGANPQIKRKRSEDAARDFADGQLAMVFLDASHDHDAVVSDLAAWFPKLRQGGILAGDDYTTKHVGLRRAVDTFADVIGRAVEQPEQGLWKLLK